MRPPEILALATQQFLKYGLRNVSMDDLCRLCGISKKTLYKHFGDKENLIRTALMGFLEEQKKTARAAETTASNALEAHFHMVQDISLRMREFNTHVVYELRKYYPALWELVEDFHKSFVLNQIRSNLRRGMQEGLYVSDLDIDLTAAFYVALIRGILLFDVELVRNYSFPVVYKYLIKYHLMAISTPQGKAILQTLFGQSQ
ncbi:MAG: TetR/AcrR family transcriptional regulator [Flavobacteriales bacterium]|nr:TetR/AcrR family transcriptional regulator [Flavobacteriales bacterium]MCX7768711.1 TetR/AcrR family transcriptional regulator [Flavobacteriales bacterium]MDW8410943.1 TetR/AcrR family transcriptional regulator [Flavobacteriales bacterium]